MPLRYVYTICCQKSMFAAGINTFVPPPRETGEWTEASVTTAAAGFPTAQAHRLPFTGHFQT